MTSKILLLSCLCILWGSRVNAQKSMILQPNANLLYLVDEHNTQKNDYLVPYIEWALKSLTYAGSDRNVFDTVRSLNILLSKKGTSVFTDAFTKQSPDVADKFVSLMFDKKLTEHDSAVLSQLYQFQYLIYIKINTFQSLLEYQFVLSRIDPTELDANKKEKGLPFNDNTNYSTASVFVDPASANYKEKIMQGLKQLVIQANECPWPAIVANCHTTGDTIYAQTNKETVLEALDNDKDSPKDQITYRWDIMDMKGRPLYRSTDKKINYRFANAGEYHLELTIHDGICDSTKKYKVIAATPPEISVTGGGCDYYDNAYHFYSFSKRPTAVSAVRKAWDVLSRINFVKEADYSYSWSSVSNGKVQAKAAKVAKVNGVYYKQTSLSICTNKNYVKGITIAELKGNEAGSLLYKAKFTGPGDYTPPVFYQEQGNSVSEHAGLSANVPDEPDTSWSYTLHCKDILLQQKQAEEVYPSEKNYRVQAAANGIASTKDISYRYHKLKNYAIVFNTAMLLNDHNNTLQNMLCLGAGAKYIPTQLLSFFGSFALAIPARNTTTTLPFDQIISAKGGLNVNIYNSRRIQVSGEALYYNHPIFSHDLLLTGRVGQAGMGISTMLMSVSQNRVGSPVELYATYYSHLSVFSQTTADYYEFGARFNIYFEQNKK